MVALIVIGSILLFFFLLLFCPVTLTASYDQEFQAQLRYFFLTIRLAPPKEKPEGEKSKKKRRSQNQSRRRGRKKSPPSSSSSWENGGWAVFCPW